MSVSLARTSAQYQKHNFMQLVRNQFCLIGSLFRALLNILHLASYKYCLGNESLLISLYKLYVLNCFNWYKIMTNNRPNCLAFLSTPTFIAANAISPPTPKSTHWFVIYLTMTNIVSVFKGVNPTPRYFDRGYLVVPPADWRHINVGVDVHC